MIKHKLIILFLFLTSLSYGQEFKPDFQSNKSLDFMQFLSGVKYAYVLIDNDKLIQNITDYPSGVIAKAFSGLISYLNIIGFDDVKWGKKSDIPQNLPSICELALVSVYWQIENNTFKDIRLMFGSCKEDGFGFKASEDILVTDNTNVKMYFQNVFMKMYGYNKHSNSLNRLSLPCEMTEWTEEKLKNHFKEKGADPIEGIYENTISTETKAKYKLCIIKDSNVYKLIYLSGAMNYLDWKEGEIKAKLTATATSYLFKANWKMLNKAINSNAYVSFDPGIMNLIIQDREKDKDVYLKLFPTSNDNITNTHTGPASATGFAISSNGLIITNHHVVNGANTIKVRGVNGDFSKTYNARVVIEDVNNDLAIIKIEDNNSMSLGNIPFVINRKTSEVGSSIFVLGFPLRSSMGEEIKLTNGIISSKSGFQGDVTSYQISAPIQPGNSGGPLFDINGNLIGIVNAKHTGAENVSYAIKTSYLFNLFDLMPSPPKLQTISTVFGKPLTEQVKILKKYTYIIEVN